MSSCCPVCLKISPGKGNPTTTARTKGHTSGTCGSTVAEYGKVSESRSTKEEKIHKRFFQLLERYLIPSGDDGGDEPTMKRGKKKVISYGGVVGMTGMSSCGNCLELMESFCQLYNDLKRIELFLNWKVERVKSILEGKGEGEEGKSPILGQRINGFRKFIKKMEGDGEVIKVNVNQNGNGWRDADEMVNAMIRKRKSLIEKCSRKMTKANNTFPKVSIVKLESPKRTAPSEQFGRACVPNSSNLRLRHDDDDDSPVDSSKIGQGPNTDITDDSRSTGGVNDDDNGSGSSLKLILDKLKLPTESRRNRKRKADANDDRGMTLVKGAKKVSRCPSHHPDPDPPQGNQEGYEVNPTSLVRTDSVPDVAEEDTISEPQIVFTIKAEHIEISQAEDNQEEPQFGVEPEFEAALEEVSNIISSPVNNYRRKQGLRTSHRCTNCDKSFSSEARLQSHIKEAHDNPITNNYNDNGGEKDSASPLENQDINQDDDDSDTSESMCWAPSSDEDEYDSGDNAESVDPLISPPMPRINSTYSVRPNKITATTSIKSKSKSTKKKKKRSEGYRSNFRLKCPDCNGLFEDVTSILTHRKSTNCGASYNPETSIKVEVLSCSKDQGVQALIDLPQAIFFCNECGLAVYSSADFEAHEKLHGSFPCHVCDTRVEYLPKLLTHELRHSPQEKQTTKEYIYTCPRCDFKSRNSIRTLLHYLKGHHSLTLNKPHCAICKTISYRLPKAELADHFKTHHDLTHATTPEHIKKCKYANCSAYFLTESQLRAHFQLHHKAYDSQRAEKLAKGRKYKCQDCTKSYHLLKHLRTHRLKAHLGSAKLIPCSVPKCPKVFETEEDLERHLKHSLTFHQSLEDPIEGGEKLQCPKCNQSFVGEIHLNQHLKSHAGQERVCEFCGKEFKDQYKLSKHYLSHSGPESWEFLCSLCSKKCLNQNKLDEHMRTHTKEKPFSCQVCGLKYAHRHNLRIHVNNKHGDQVQDVPRKFTKRDSGKGKKKARASKTNEVEASDTLMQKRSRKGKRNSRENNVETAVGT